ncbi:MAG: phosphoribosyl transferase [Treponema sp.]|nr:MAG: phosphoribosyl transferase [Treponema sp.]
MKEFVDFETVRNNAFALARRIFDDGFKPDVMYVSMRGGAYMGNAMNEFFKVAYGENYDITFATLVARSYSGVHSSGEVILDGWTFPPEKLASENKVLIVDDICDSGKTFKLLCDFLLKVGLKRENIKFAVHDYKCFHNLQDHSVDFVPDYYCKKHDITSEEENNWIHYLSHELTGLTSAELDDFYFKKYPELKDVFEGILP